MAALFLFFLPIAGAGASGFRRGRRSPGISWRRGGDARITSSDGRVHALDRVLLHARSVVFSFGRTQDRRVESPLPPLFDEAWAWLTTDVHPPVEGRS